MEAAGAHWEPVTIPCGIFPSASWQSFQHPMCCDGQCKISNPYLTGVPGACRAGGFLGRWPHKPCQQKSDPLISPWNCSPALLHWARLLPDVTQVFPIDSDQLFPNRFPRKPWGLQTCPRCSAWHGVCCCQWPQNWLHPMLHWIPGKLHTFTPGKSQAQSRNSDILLLYKQKS